MICFNLSELLHLTMTIEGLLNKVKTVNLRAELPAIIKRNAADAILLNQLQLFQFGTNSQGIKLKEYKNKYYAKKKNAKNPQPGLGTPDLADKRDFYNGFFLDVKVKTFRIDSKDSKSSKLKKDYGADIFGLSVDNTRTFALDNILPAVQRYITTKTGLQFR